MKITVKVRERVYSQEAAMNEFPYLAKTNLAKNSLAITGRLAAALVCLCGVYLAVSGVRLVRAQSARSVPTSETALLAEFSRVEVATGCDALDQLLGKRMYMSHRMHSIVNTPLGC